MKGETRSTGCWGRRAHSLRRPLGLAGAEADHKLRAVHGNGYFGSVTMPSARCSRQPGSFQEDSLTFVSISCGSRSSATQDSASRTAKAPRRTKTLSQLSTQCQDMARTMIRALTGPPRRASESSVSAAASSRITPWARDSSNSGEGSGSAVQANSMDESVPTGNGSKSSSALPYVGAHAPSVCRECTFTPRTGQGSARGGWAVMTGTVRAAAAACHRLSAANR